MSAKPRFSECENGILNGKSLLRTINNSCVASRAAQILSSMSLAKTQDGIGFPPGDCLPATKAISLQPRQPQTMFGIILLAASVAVVGGLMPPYVSTSIQANTFLDNVLRSALLPPAAPLQDFQFTVKKTALTNRQVKAKFRNGSVRKTGPVRRSDDCTAPVWVGGNISFVCSINLGSINATYEAELKGETLLGKSKKALRASGLIPEIKAKFEATARPGFPLLIKNIIFDSIDVETDFSKKISLNAERLKSLHDSFEKKVLSEVYSVLYNHYADEIKSLLQSRPFPAF